MADFASKLDFLKISKCKKLDNLEKEMKVALSKAITAGPIEAVCLITSDKMKFRFENSKKNAISAIQYRDAKSLIESESLRTLVIAICNEAKTKNTLIVSIRFRNKDDYLDAVKYFSQVISGDKTGNLKKNQQSESNLQPAVDNLEPKLSNSCSSKSSSTSSDTSSRTQSEARDSKPKYATLPSPDDSPETRATETSHVAQTSSRSRTHKTISLTEFDPFPKLIYINKAIMDLFVPSRHVWHSQISDETDAQEFKDSDAGNDGPKINGNYVEREKSVSSNFSSSESGTLSPIR